MNSSNGEFLFERAWKDFQEQIIKDLNDDAVNSIPLFSERYKNYNGVEPEKRTAADQMLRDLICKQITNKTKDSNMVENALKIISVSISVAKEGHCSPSIPFILLGDILDTFTLDECDVVFSFIEDGVSEWKSPVFYTAGKNYLLRMCNDLLRRLSQSRNTVFCGRIQLFLARLFPLSEKSALNLVSQFNLENVTVFNKDKSNTTLSDHDDETNNSTSSPAVKDEPETMEVDNVDASKSTNIVDYKLYVNIWSLQDIFRYPVQCYSDSWTKFVENSEEVFKVLSSYKLEETCAGKRSVQTHKKSYFSKFLTSEKLIDLQLSDGMFRRQLYIQFLILFRYLTANIKFKGSQLVLTESQKAWISKTEPMIYELLNETPPDGKTFAKYVKHLMSREEFWTSWKNDGCPSFVKNKSKVDSSADIRKGRKRRNPSELPRIAQDFINKKALGMGSPELTKLWECSDNLEACKSPKREFLPSLKDFFEESFEQEDPKNEIEDEYKSTNNANFQWKALRLLSKRSQLFFQGQPVQQQFKTIPKYLSSTILKLAKEFPKPAQAAQTNGTTNGDADAKEDEEEEAVSEPGFDDEDMNDDASAMNGDDIEENGNTDSEAAVDPEKVTDDDITKYANSIGDNWCNVATALKLSEKQIMQIKEDSDDAVMQARQTIITWQDTASSTTKSELLKVLSECKIEIE